MNLLALDTTKRTANISLDKAGAVFYASTVEGESHSETLLVKIDEIIKHNRLDIEDIDVFSVCIGPGSFTGIRIGISMVKAFLFSSSAKCVAVNSFELLAYNISECSSDFFVAFNADNRGCYVALFDKNKQIKNILLNSIEELKEEVGKTGFPLFVKEEDASYFEVIKNKQIVKVTNDTFIEISKEKVAKKEFTTINELEPLYIKLSQAEDQFKQKLIKNLVIEKATLTDLLELEALEKAIFEEEAYSKDSLKEELTSADRLFLVAKLNDEMIGYAVTLKTADNLLNILKIATKPIYQKLSVATQLFNKVKAYQEENKYDSIFLEVNEHNQKALSFYKKLGFVEKHKREKYYKDGSSAIIMFL